MQWLGHLIPLQMPKNYATLQIRGKQTCCRILSIKCVSRQHEKRVFCFVSPFQKESGGVLLLNEDRTRSVNTLTSPACQIIEMYAPLRRQHKCFGSQWDFFDWIKLLLFVFFLENLLAANSTPFAHFLNSLNSFWRGHPLWLQLHHHHNCLANPDTVPCSNSCRSYSEASAMSKPMFKSNASFLLWQGCSLWLLERTSIFNEVEYVALCTLRSLILSLRSFFIWQELIKRKSKFQALAKAREQCDLQSSDLNGDKLLQKTVLLSLVYHNESKNSRGCVCWGRLLWWTYHLKVYEIFSPLCLHVFNRAICILRLSSSYSLWLDHIVYYYNMLFLRHLELLNWHRAYARMFTWN